MMLAAKSEARRDMATAAITYESPSMDMEMDMDMNMDLADSTSEGMEMPQSSEQPMDQRRWKIRLWRSQQPLSREVTAATPDAAFRMELPRSESSTTDAPSRPGGPPPPAAAPGGGYPGVRQGAWVAEWVAWRTGEGGEGYGEGYGGGGYGSTSGEVAGPGATARGYGYGGGGYEGESEGRQAGQAGDQGGMQMDGAAPPTGPARMMANGQVVSGLVPQQQGVPRSAYQCTGGSRRPGRCRQVLGFAGAPRLGHRDRSVGRRTDVSQPGLRTEVGHHGLSEESHELARVECRVVDRGTGTAADASHRCGAYSVRGTGIDLRLRAPAAGRPVHRIRTRVSTGVDGCLGADSHLGRSLRSSLAVGAGRPASWLPSPPRRPPQSCW